MTERKCVRGLNYIPSTALMVEEHIVTKSKYTVIDAHTHCGKLVLGDGYETMYAIDEYVEKLKGFGIRKVVNHDGYWGKELDKMLKKIGKYQGRIQNCS